MSIPKVFESEYRFCLILWDHEPIKSRDLAQLCEEQLGYHLHGNKAFVGAWRDKE